LLLVRDLGTVASWWCYWVGLGVGGDALGVGDGVGDGDDVLGVGVGVGCEAT
jgi:hypothetical protein